MAQGKISKKQMEILEYIKSELLRIVRFAKQLTYAPLLPYMLIWNP